MSLFNKFRRALQSTSAAIVVIIQQRQHEQMLRDELLFGTDVRGAEDLQTFTRDYSASRPTQAGTSFSRAIRAFEVQQNRSGFKYTGDRTAADRIGAHFQEGVSRRFGITVATPAKEDAAPPETPRTPATTGVPYNVLRK